MEKMKQLLQQDKVRKTVFVIVGVLVAVMVAASVILTLRALRACQSEQSR